MNRSSIPIKISCLLALLLSVCAAHAFDFPTLLKPKEMPLTVYREFAFAPVDSSGTPINGGQVAFGIANAYLEASRFPPFSNEIQDYASSTLTLGKGVTHGPVSQRGGAGVQVGVGAADLVRVEYHAETVNSSGTGVTNTTTLLRIAPVEGKPGHYFLSATSLSERIGTSPGSGFFPVKPVAPMDTIAADVANTVANMKPRLRLQFQQKDEFESPYPVSAVFASFVRQLGNPGKSDAATPPDLREGNFNLPFKNQRQPVAVKIYPYHDHTKISTRFTVPYEMDEEHGSNLLPDDIHQMSDMLKKIAAD